MSGDWVVVARGEHDLEEVADARTVLAECPSCGSRVRLTERELVRNLKVLGVALIATERAGRVYQCPRCDALCAREGDALPLGLAAGEVDDARVEALTERVLKAEDESALWAQRAAVADERGETALATEMREQSSRSARASRVLRKELAALTGVRGPLSAAEDTAQGPTPTEAAPPAPTAEAEVSSDPPAQQGDTLERELAALRERVQSRRRPATAPSASSDAPDAPDDELASLKAKLGRGAAPTAAAPSEPVAEAPPPSAAPPPPSSDDDDLAAMKRNLRKKD